MDYILSATLARLDELLSQEVKVLSGIENHVKVLQKQLATLEHLLKQCDARKFADLDGLFLDLSSIIDAAHKVDDVIENYALNSEPVAAGRAINFIKRLAFSDKHEATIKIEAIIRRFSYILESRTIDVLSQFSRASETVDEDLRCAYEIEQNRSDKPPLIRHKHVGINEKVEQVVDSLVDVTKSPFVAICDRPGAGKTTLGKKVYNHTKVRCHFEYFAWVYIYDNPFSSEMGYLAFNEGAFYDHLFLEILHKLVDGNNINYKMLAALGKTKSILDDILQGNKCLVVLDDKFDRCGALEGLPSHFLHPLTGSKFLFISGSQLMTARNIIVHRLPGFNREDAWQLLQSIIDSVKDSPDYDMQLETLGRNIAKHLSGWPWAIMVAGGILAGKLCAVEWQKVYDDIASSLAYSEESDHDPLQGLFMLCYMNLPTGLKPYLFYLRQFPVWHEINVSKLVRLWIAEGFVSSRVPETVEEGKTLEDLAENNLNELISRGLVLVGNRDASFRVTTCHLHETVRSLCLSKVNLSSLNFQIDSAGCDFAIHQHTHSYRFPKSDGAELRSFLFFQRCYGRLSMRYPNFDKYRSLRVLDLEDADFGEENFPRSICDLIHLRYLSLRNARVSKIPSTLGNLRFLQTLDLLVEGKSVFIPDVIWKLNRLRHLFLPEVCHTKVKLRLDTLTNLRTLVNFSARNCDLKDLFVMTKMRELSIRDAMSIRNFARFSKLLGMKLQHLHTFSIYDSSREGDKEEYKEMNSASFRDIND